MRIYYILNKDSNKFIDLGKAPSEKLGAMPEFVLLGAMPKSIKYVSQ